MPWTVTLGGIVPRLIGVAGLWRLGQSEGAVHIMWYQVAVDGAAIEISAATLQH